MNSIIYYSKPQKVNQLNVPNISKRGFSKLPLVFGKTSMEVNIHWMHWTTVAYRKVSNISSHLASRSRIWSHTLGYTHRFCPRAPTVRRGPWRGEKKASPGCGIFLFCNRGMRVQHEDTGKSLSFMFQMVSCWGLRWAQMVGKMKSQESFEQQDPKDAQRG